jgi:hypothetical protein
MILPKHIFGGGDCIDASACAMDLRTEVAPKVKIPVAPRPHHPSK